MPRNGCPIGMTSQIEGSRSFLILCELHRRLLSELRENWKAAYVDNAIRCFSQFVAYISPMPTSAFSLILCHFSNARAPKVSLSRLSGQREDQ